MSTERERALEVAREWMKQAAPNTMERVEAMLADLILREREAARADEFGRGASASDRKWERIVDEERERFERRGYDNGHADGQREMRERAAVIAYDSGTDVCAARNIRALPLTPAPGEEHHSADAIHGHVIERIPEGAQPEQTASQTWPFVLAFACEMERKLSLNRHKGDRDGWIGMRLGWLHGRLLDELTELESATTSNDPSAVLSEAADVANFAMMMADVAGGLTPAPCESKGEPQGEQPAERSDRTEGPEPREGDVMALEYIVMGKSGPNFLLSPLGTEHHGIDAASEFSPGWLRTHGRLLKRATREGEGS